MQGIYSITNRENGRQYIGSAVDIERRWRWHVSRLNTGKHDNEHLQRAWNKYGQGVFEFAVVEHVSDVALLGSREDAHLRGVSQDCSYNICREVGRPPASKGRTYGQVVRANMAAAQRGRKHSAETRAKMSASWKPRHTPESLARAAAKLRGRTRTLTDAQKATIAAVNRRNWLGRKHTPEALAKMSAAKAGTVPSAEARAKMSAASLGKPKSATHRANIARGRTGIKLSAETLAKMAEDRRARADRSSGVVF